MTECNACAPGKFKEESNSTTACTQCSAGSFANISGTSLCSVCFAGSYAEVAGLSECVACLAGNFKSVPNSTTTCSACVMGSFAESKGSSACALCTAGTWSNQTGASVCESCFRGRYQSNVGVTAQSQCLLCEAGSFASLLGTSECGVCAAGSWVDGQGSTECMRCSSGKFGATPGATSEAVCSECLAGSFANSSGASVCDACAAGSFVGEKASTECALCTPGYSAILGSVTCSACAIGSSAGASGMPQCALCTPGTASSVTGQTACTACAAGKHYGGLGGAECSSCIPGSYIGTDGGAVCYPCNVGSFVNTSGTTQCIACAAGMAAPLPGLPVCKAFASYFGKATGTWDVTYNDGSVGTIIVAENGDVVATSDGDGSVSGRLQPATGEDVAAGWDYRVVDLETADEEYLLKIANGTMIVDRYVDAQRTQGIGAPRAAQFEEEGAIPVLPIVAGTVAFATLLLLCSFCAWRRCQAQRRGVNKAADVDSVSGHHHASDPEIVSTPKLLGTGQCFSERGSKYGKSMGSGHDFKSVAPVTCKGSGNKFNSVAPGICQAILQCPAGHALVDCRVPCPGLCDGCGRRVEQGQHAMDCRTCDWILCDSCSVNKAVGASGIVETEEHPLGHEGKGVTLPATSSDQHGQPQQTNSGSSHSTVVDIDSNPIGDLVRSIDLEAAEVPLPTQAASISFHTSI